MRREMLGVRAASGRSYDAANGWFQDEKTAPKGGFFMVQQQRGSGLLRLADDLDFHPAVGGMTCNQV